MTVDSKRVKRERATRDVIEAARGVVFGWQSDTDELAWLKVALEAFDALPAEPAEDGGTDVRRTSNDPETFVTTPTPRDVLAMQGMYRVDHGDGTVCWHRERRSGVPDRRAPEPLSRMTSGRTYDPMLAHPEWQTAASGDVAEDGERRTRYHALMADGSRPPEDDWE